MWQYTDGDIQKATQNTFRLLTSRLPNEREQAILLEQYQAELQYFSTNKDNAVTYLEIGHYPNTNDFPKPEVAALARVSNTIMNSTEAYYKN